MLENNGNTTVTVSCIYLGSVGDSVCSGNGIFEFTPPTLPATLGPNSSINLSITYNASGTSPFDTLEANFSNPCGTSLTATAPINVGN